ncbi:Nematode Specific Peptide family, group C [Caenorhabditis elegans]|uniref:Nematode Specific Peptide family, group C n=1 Tax=Caenorhabditis elegans TaxID=6239 RepID=G5EC48_CAEEL|nr:Nematode Specific Peptide family, group C [Caenorhabditis elegans]NP_510074.2 Nematode Specific Peptide family, group C [Caenorhabditis elegans]CAD54144.1 Nematode Specific Peptide family, group C [Caenorhabditis elegans]CAH60761.1 Nematode Specific Peptide family, group C [Caenorhabditis elegans]|eukprot:NP_001024657.1 Nematode Specific Peptide family, group C [Caenorhabditis elegans]
MFLRTLVALCLVSAISSITLQLCQEFCAGVNGGESYAFCSPWISFATHRNKTCYNLCVHNCAAVYDGSCTTDKDFRCCLKTTPAKKQEFKMSGCNKLYNNL